MGNQVSSQSNEDAGKKPKMLVAFEKNSSKDEWFVDNLSYKGILSKNSVSSEGQSTAVKQNSKDTCEEDTTADTVNNNQEINEIKVVTNFEWKDEGNVVYLTGDFCNWSQKFLMNKVNNKFELSLDLIRGVYQYKFIIDGVWKYSRHHSNCNDGRGNINNIVDSSNFPLPVKEKVVKILKIDDEKLKEISFKKDQSKLDADTYSSQIPAKNDLYVEALLCPSNYQDYYNINHISNQHLIGKEEFLFKYDDFLFYEDNSSRKISVPPHVNLNHLCSAKINSKKGVLHTSTPHRVRNKYCTIIYYKPVN